MAQTANIVQLKPRTLQAFETYIRDAEAAMEPTLRGERPFLFTNLKTGEGAEKVVAWIRRDLLFES